MSRSRRKLDTSPIEYDDVVDSPALKGMVSFLEIPPGELPRLDFTAPAVGPKPQSDEGVPLSSAPAAAPPESESSGAPLSGAPETGGAETGAPAVAPAPDTPTVISGAPELELASPPPPEPLLGTGPENPGLQPPVPAPRPPALDPKFQQGTPFSTAPLIAPPLKPPPLSTPPLPDVPASTAPFFFPPVLSRPLTRIRRATLAQDGHSFGEQALYDALWQHAHPYEGDTRIITIGYRRMAELARLTVNNCKANIQSLIQKLAVEEVAGFTHSQGRTYLVFNYSAILQRRREAGLTHYIKSRGVAFVNPDTGEPLTARIRDKSGIPFLEPPARAAVPEGDRPGAPPSGVPGTPLSAATPYSQPSRHFSGTTTSSSPNEPAPAALIQGLRQVLDFIDDEAAAVLWHQCRRRAADCTPEEILHFTRAKAAIFRSGKIQNPTGFLLTAVPKCFEGASFSDYRHEQLRLQQFEAERAKDAEDQMRLMRRDFEAILADPASSEEDRRFVERLLKTGRGGEES